LNIIIIVVIIYYIYSFIYGCDERTAMLVHCSVVFHIL